MCLDHDHCLTAFFAASLLLLGSCEFSNPFSSEETQLKEDGPQNVAIYIQPATADQVNLFISTVKTITQLSVCTNPSENCRRQGAGRRLNKVGANRDGERLIYEMGAPLDLAKHSDQAAFLSFVGRDKDGKIVATQSRKVYFPKQTAVSGGTGNGNLPTGGTGVPPSSTADNGSQPAQDDTTTPQPAPGSSEPAPDTNANDAEFANLVQPIMNKSCAVRGGCHLDGKSFGGFVLSKSHFISVKQKIVERLETDDPGKRMPPPWNAAVTISAGNRQALLDYISRVR